jgi:serine/threonine protein kinase
LQLHESPAVRSGSFRSEITGTDTHTGPITDVERRVAALVTPFELRSVASEIEGATALDDHALGIAPTPRVEVSDELTRWRAPTCDRVLADRYRLGRQLGVGGYGTVFSAEDLVTGDRVAVKVLSPAASQNHELIIRLHREAIAASRARHPHIVDVADFDVDEVAGHFIVMEHLDGRDLAQTLAEEKALAPVRALVIAAQCARGLAAAHRVGVLHRDLKPANVFLVRHADGGHAVKIIDFGISKLTHVAGDYTDVTSASKVVGTPCYMSPEQARGRELDARSDVYALGVMLFEMLVGERPFTGRAPIEILGKHMSAPRVAPSVLRPELATCPGLDALVIRALSPDPANRFDSMEALGDAILACLRAIDPDVASHATELTGEQTDRAAPTLVGDDDAVRTTRTTAGRRLHWLVAATIVIAASIGVWSWRSRVAETAAPRGASEAPREPSAAAAPVGSDAPVAAAPAPSASTDAAPVAREVTITSSPSGAIVYRDGERLGLTPLRVELETTTEASAFSVEAPGHYGRRVIVGRDQDAVKVVLRAKRPRPAPRTASPRGVAEW